MRNLDSIKPQDFLVLMKSIVSPGLPQNKLASSLLISPAEISHGIRRLKKAGLLTSDGRANQANALEFFVHALKFICPVQLGPPTLGVPTAHSHPDFNFVRYAEDDRLVWPNGHGSKKGTSIVPIYPTLPEACSKDEKLYEFASFVEMIRAGRARERNIAVKKLDEMIGGSL